MGAEVELSVVIPACNRLPSLCEAIESVLRQKDVATEIIVVDDSVDGSSAKIKDLYPFDNVTYIRRESPSNKRPALVRNQGAAMAKGQFIYFLDDDDTSCPGALAFAVSTLKANPNVSMVYGKVIPFGDNPVKLEINRQYFNHAAFRAKRLFGRHFFAAYHAFCPTTFVCGAALGRIEAFRHVNGFDATIPLAEDLDMWLRVSRVGGFRFLNIPVLNYRTGATSLMNDVVVQDPRVKESYRIIQGKFFREVGYFKSLLLKIAARIFLNVVDFEWRFFRKDARV